MIAVQQPGENRGTFPWSNPYNWQSFMDQLLSGQDEGAAQLRTYQPTPLSPGTPGETPPASIQVAQLPPGQPMGGELFDTILNDRLREWGIQRQRDEAQRAEPPAAPATEPASPVPVQNPGGSPSPGPVQQDTSAIDQAWQEYYAQAEQAQANYQSQFNWQQYVMQQQLQVDAQSQQNYLAWIQQQQQQQQPQRYVQPSGELGTWMNPQPAMLSFGGWAWGDVPVQNIANAGFNWFEVGYPGTISVNDANYLLSRGVTPFGYVNIGKLDPNLSTGYNGPLMGGGDGWNVQKVDIGNPSWQSWIIRRVDEAWAGGMRGIKFDDVQADQIPAQIRLLEQVRARHPGIKIILNQGFDLALQRPDLVDAIETEGLFSNTNNQPWNDPTGPGWWWGPQYQKAKQLQAQGIRIIAAEYMDPYSSAARATAQAIIGAGFIPYITSSNWQQRGLGYNINPGW